MSPREVFVRALLLVLISTVYPSFGEAASQRRVSSLEQHSAERCSAEKRSTRARVYAVPLLAAFSVLGCAPTGGPTVPKVSQAESVHRTHQLAILQAWGYAESRRVASYESLRTSIDRRGTHELFLGIPGRRNYELNISAKTAAPTQSGPSTVVITLNRKDPNYRPTRDPLHAPFVPSVRYLEQLSMQWSTQGGLSYTRSEPLKGESHSYQTRTIRHPEAHGIIRLARFKPDGAPSSTAVNILEALAPVIEEFPEPVVALVNQAGR